MERCKPAAEGSNPFFRFEFTVFTVLFPMFKPCKLVSHLNGGCLGRQGLDALVCPAQLLGRHAPDGAQAALLLVQPSHHVRLADDVGDVA